MSQTAIEKISFENVAVVYNEDVAESYAVAQNTLNILKSKGINSKIVSSSSEEKNFSSNFSFIMTVGGDGTILKAARHYSDLPIFGINLGRLGFLAQADPDEMESAVEKLRNGDYKIQKRMMLSAFNCNFEGEVNALNDMVIKGDTFSRTSRLFLYINDKPVCDYLADGLIISTPTGSTAYTLSAGGPVISPELDAMVIVPICPHTLTSRPLVIRANETIKISSCKTCNKMKLSADGQNTIDIALNDFVTIKKSQNEANLVILNKEDNEFYSILRKKLHWGIAPKG